MNEGEIWWCRVGENVGSEISGKGEKFTRPVLIFTKYSKKKYFVIPLSTKIKFTNGSAKKEPWFVQYKHNSRSVVASLTEARSIDYRRLNGKMGANG